LVVAITGATGVVYGAEMLKVLNRLGVPVHLILSESAVRNFAIETDYKVDEIEALADVVYKNRDIAAAVASGSFKTRGMVVVPCTIKSLSAIANSYTENLVVRAADVTLKERRRLVLMVRETPLHKGHLELMMRCADLGAVILPPMPAFYHGPKTIMDLVHQSIGKALDQFDIEHNLFERWTGAKRKRHASPIGVEGAAE
jgi:4-hydroxy-3-polyprenylbenzoate decarboxylase